jgi:hypothetical protein
LIHAHYVAAVDFHLHDDALLFIVINFMAALTSQTGPFYVMIASKTMQAIHIVVFVRAPLARCVQNVARHFSPLSDIV